MTLAHFIYIPGVLLFGIVVGYVLGGRAAQLAKAEHEDRAERRKARETARRARDRAAREASPD
ncbi:MAG: hypothetical protein KDK70_09255 [Myxococcales bacterium]|nr:hypothetical protein [Myxococcales bacterium]